MIMIVICSVREEEAKASKIVIVQVSFSIEQETLFSQGLMEGAVEVAHRYLVANTDHEIDLEDYVEVGVCSGSLLEKVDHALGSDEAWFYALKADSSVFVIDPDKGECLKYAIGFVRYIQGCLGVDLRLRPDGKDTAHAEKTYLFSQLSPEHRGVDQIAHTEMLDLNIGHTPGESPDFGPCRWAEHEHGWIVFVSGDEDLENVPGWLRPACALAQRRGCVLINFDQDGLKYNSLPTWEW